MKVVRSVLAIVVGIAVSMVTMIAIQMASRHFFPLPEGVDPSNMQQLKEVLPAMPTGAFVFVLCAWIAGAFIGGATAALIAGWARVVHAALIGVFVLTGTILLFRMLPGHPDWMILVALLQPLPVSMLAGKLVSLLCAPPAAPPTPTSAP